MNGNLKVLDCTLRDGGQCLENLNANGIETPVFTDEEKIKIASLVRDSGIEIVEIGCISLAAQNLEKYAVYHRIEDLSEFLPKKTNSNQIYTGLYIDPDTPVEEIPDASSGLVDGVRVILRYSELQKSLDFCRALSQKGYKVFVQPMLTMRYTDEELEKLVYSANEMGAYALYFVDSFGYMNEKDVERLYKFYGHKLDEKIRIGFHAHNNMENAMANARFFIEALMNRDCIVDSCAIGMGQGAGNLQTEVLINYLNKNYGTAYDLNSVLEICDILEKFRPHDMKTWGYSPVRFVPAVHDAAYKYAVAMKTQFNMSLVEINKALAGIPDEMRHRYTPSNLKKIIETLDGK